MRAIPIVARRSILPVSILLQALTASCYEREVHEDEASDWSEPLRREDMSQAFEWTGAREQDAAVSVGCGDPERLGRGDIALAADKSGEVLKAVQFGSDARVTLEAEDMTTAAVLSSCNLISMAGIEPGAELTLCPGVAKQLAPEVLGQIRISWPQVDDDRVTAIRISIGCVSVTVPAERRSVVLSYSKSCLTKNETFDVWATSFDRTTGRPLSYAALRDVVPEENARIRLPMWRTDWTDLNVAVDGVDFRKGETRMKLYARMGIDGVAFVIPEPRAVRFEGGLAKSSVEWPADWSGDLELRAVIAHDGDFDGDRFEPELWSSYAFRTEVPIREIELRYGEELLPFIALTGLDPVTWKSNAPLKEIDGFLFRERKAIFMTLPPAERGTAFELAIAPPGAEAIYRIALPRFLERECAAWSRPAPGWAWTSLSAIDLGKVQGYEELTALDVTGALERVRLGLELSESYRTSGASPTMMTAADLGCSWCRFDWLP